MEKAMLADFDAFKKASESGSPAQARSPRRGQRLPVLR